MLYALTQPLFLMFLSRVFDDVKAADVAIDPPKASSVPNVTALIVAVDSTNWSELRANKYPLLGICMELISGKDKIACSLPAKDPLLQAKMSASKL